MYYDRNMEFMRDRSFWLGMIFFGIFTFYAYRRYFVEKDRMMRTERREKIQDFPAHHYSNRGGVLILKEFIGFEKYFRNEERMMNWYKMSYPQQFASKEVKEE